jgi:hypothetical protein
MSSKISGRHLNPLQSLLANLAEHLIDMHVEDGRGHPVCVSRRILQGPEHVLFIISVRVNPVAVVAVLISPPPDLH